MRSELRYKPRLKIMGTDHHYIRIYQNISDPGANLQTPGKAQEHKPPICTRQVINRDQPGPSARQTKRSEHQLEPLEGHRLHLTVAFTNKATQWTQP